MRNAKYSLDELIRELDDEFVEERCFDPHIRSEISKRNVVKKIKAAIRPSRKPLKKRYVLLAALIAGITGVSVSAGVRHYHYITGAELVDDTNRDLIGTDVYIGTEGMMIFESEEMADEYLANLPEPTMPESTIVRDCYPVEGNMMPGSIGEFATAETEEGFRCPEVITTNGAMALFTKPDGSGWHLSPGQTLTFSYRLHDGSYRSLKTGVVKNHTQMPGVFRDEQESTYSMTVEEEGEYYIYFINYSSDYVSLETGSITVQ